MVSLATIHSLYRSISEYVLRESDWSEWRMVRKYIQYSSPWEQRSLFSYLAALTRLERRPRTRSFFLVCGKTDARESLPTDKNTDSRPCAEQLLRRIEGAQENALA